MNHRRPAFEPAGATQPETSAIEPAAMLPSEVLSRVERWGVPIAAGGPAPTADLAANRMSTGNLVEFLTDHEIFERWLTEALALEQHGTSAALLMAGWRLQAIAMGGRLDTGPTVYEILRRLAAAGVAIPIRLSGHGFGAANFFPSLQLRSLKSITIDRYMPWTASSHEKLTVFCSPSAVRAIVSSADFSKRRWDTSRHLAADPRRYARNRPSHELAAFVDGQAAKHLADGNLMRHRGYRSVRGERLGARPSNRLPVIVDPPERDHAFGSVVQILSTVPYHYGSGMPDEEYSLRDGYANAISKARSFVYVEDQFFWSVSVPPAPDDIVQLLIERVRGVDGVNVIVIVPWPKSGLLGTVEAGRRALAVKALLRAQDSASGKVIIATPFRGNTPVYVHAKTLIVDDEYALVGSGNVNRRSFQSDFEVGLGIADPHRVRHLRQRLWAEHLGLDVTEVSSVNAGISKFKAALATGDRLRRPPMTPGRLTGSTLERMLWDGVLDPKTRR